MNTFKLDNIICITSDKEEQRLFELKNHVLVANEKTNTDFIECISHQSISINDIAQKIFSEYADSRLLSIYAHTNYGPVHIRFTHHGLEQIFLNELTEKLPEKIPNQWAFMFDNKVKFCFSHNTILTVPPTNYKGIIFPFSNWKNKYNTGIYEVLTRSVEDQNKQNAVSIIKKYCNIKTNLPFKERLNNTCADTSVCILSFTKHALGIQTYKSRIEKEISRLKLPQYTFKHLPFIVLQCETKNISQLTKNLNSHFPIDILPARSIYLPEIVREYTFKKTSLHPNLEEICVSEAHKITKGKGTKVGIVDTGIEYTHDDLISCFNEVKGYDFITDSKEIIDENGHGTHVAGIVAGKTTGVAPECTLYSLRILDEKGVGNEIDLLKALDWAIENKLDIINLSLGHYEPSSIEEKALQIVKSKDITVVCASGNDGRENYMYPASYEGTISVGAVIRGNRAYFSTYNDRLTISAPGVSIVSTYLENSFHALDGTSMAAPHVTGVYALLKSINSLNSPELLEETLQCTALKLGPRKQYGAGLVRADRAVYNIINRKTIKHV